jgi:hypothetical protein
MHIYIQDDAAIHLGRMRHRNVVINRASGMELRMADAGGCIQTAKDLHESLLVCANKMKISADHAVALVLGHAHAPRDRSWILTWPL